MTTRFLAKVTRYNGDIAHQSSNVIPIVMTGAPENVTLAGAAEAIHTAFRAIETRNPADARECHNVPTENGIGAHDGVTEMVVHWSPTYNTEKTYATEHNIGSLMILVHNRGDMHIDCHIRCHGREPLAPYIFGGPPARA